MNTKPHSNSSESQIVRFASCVYTSTVIIEMSKMPRKMYLSVSDNEKRRKKFKEGRESCRKFPLQIKNIGLYVRSSSHNF
jgi:hypothetical protein